MLCGLWSLLLQPHCYPAPSFCLSYKSSSHTLLQLNCCLYVKFMQHWCTWTIDELFVTSMWLNCLIACPRVIVIVGLFVLTVCCEPTTLVNWEVVLTAIHFYGCYDIAIANEVSEFNLPSMWTQSWVYEFVKKEYHPSHSFFVFKKSVINCNFKGTMDLTFSQLVLSFRYNVREQSNMVHWPKKLSVRNIIALPGIKTFIEGHVIDLMQLHRNQDHSVCATSFEQIPQAILQYWSCPSVM
jgi:hypothetical protein